MRRLFVTEWAPNGTNDLIVLNDDDNSVHEVIQSATFGIDTGINTIDIDGETIYAKPITLLEVKRYLCVSPADPDGMQVIKQLFKALK